MNSWSGVWIRTRPPDISARRREPPRRSRRPSKAHVSRRSCPDRYRAADDSDLRCRSAGHAVRWQARSRADAPFDLTLLLLLSNAIQNAMTDPGTSVLGGIVAASTLLLLNSVIAEPS